MVEVLVLGRDTYLDDLTQQEIDARIAEDPGFAAKYDRRLRRGDFIDVKGGGHFIPDHFRRDTFVVIGISDMDDPVPLRKYLQAWHREVTWEKILNDTTNHIYDYRITVNQTSIAGTELFDNAKDILYHKEDISIISKSPTQVVIRFEPLKNPNVINGGTTIESRIEKVETRGRQVLFNISRRLRNKRYRIDLGALPQVVKDALRNDGYYITTKAVALNYIEDKSLL